MLELEDSLPDDLLFNQEGLKQRIHSVHNEHDYFKHNVQDLNNFSNEGIEDSEPKYEIKKEPELVIPEPNMNPFISNQRYKSYSTSPTSANEFNYLKKFCKIGKNSKSLESGFLNGTSITKAEERILRKIKRKMKNRVRSHFIF